MIQVEKEIVKQAKDLFQNYKLQNCREFVDDVDKQRSFTCHQMLQLYKGLSLFELGLVSNGYQSFEQIIQEGLKQKGDKVEEVDVLIRFFFQIQVYYCDQFKCEELNSILFQVSEDYHKQNYNSQHYQKEIYLFGKGLHLFIENHRDLTKMEGFSLMEEAYEITEEFKQDILILLGWMYFTKDKKSESEMWNQRLYDLNPKYPRIANILAIVKKAKKEMVQAEKLYLEAESLCPTNYVILQNIALFYANIKKEEKEGHYYKQAYLLNLNNARPYQRYGLFLYQRGQEEEAIKLLQQGIEIDPYYYGNYDQLAEIEMDRKNYEKSLVYYLKISDINKNDIYNQHKIGQCYELLCDYESAIESYRKATLLKNYLNIKQQCHLKIAVCYSQLQDYDKSLVECFNSCNYQSLGTKFSEEDDNEDDDDDEIDEINETCYIINYSEDFEISLQTIIYQINSQQGLILTKFKRFSEYVEDQNLKALFLSRLDILRTVISILAYKTNVEQFLNYQANLSHWDLYID